MGGKRGGFHPFTFNIMGQGFESHSPRPPSTAKSWIRQIPASTAARFPLFPGQNESDQIQKIHNAPGCSAEFLFFMSSGGGEGGAQIPF